MKIPDVNLLLYAVNEDAPQHGKASAWLEGALSGSDPVGFDWTVLLAFLRISTRAGIFSRPLSPDQALESIALWLDQPCAEIIDPAERHREVLARLLGPLGTAGNLTSDAQPRGAGLGAGGGALLL